MATVYLNEASGRLGVDVDVLKAIRKMPKYTKYFINGRIDVEGLKEHIDDILDMEHQEPETSEYWKKRKLKADAQVSEIELDEMRKKFLDKDEVISFLKQVASSQRALLKTKLVHELPSKLLGLNVTEQSVIMEKELNEVLKIFQNGIDAWTK